MNVSCEYCDEMDHSVSDCPNLAAWREREDIQEMLSTAAYYQVPKGALEK